MKIMFLVDNLVSGGACMVVNRLTETFYHDFGYEVIRVAVYQYCEDTSQSDVIYFRNKENPEEQDSFFKIVRNINKAIMKEKPDIVISFLTPVNICALVARLFHPYKLIISERSNPYLAPENKRQRILRRLLYSFADLLVCQSESSSAFFSERIKKTIIENPLPGNLVDLSERTDDIVVSVGRLIESKNISMAIQAFKKISNDHPELSFNIFGEGPLRKDLESIIRENNMENKVFLQGQKKDVLEDVSRAKLFVFPSDYEGFSNAVLEAVALGIPVVTTDHPTADVTRLVENKKNGIVVPVRDEKAFYEGMKKVLENYESYKTEAIKKAAIIRKEYSMEKISRKWVEAINAVLNK